jgi:hypothetical protein
LGPQGKDVIVSTLCRLFTPCFPETRSRLADNIAEIIAENPNAFDSASDTAPPEILSLELFVEFVLVPHIATRLIAEDMCGSLVDANDIRADRNDFGEIFHWNLEDSVVLSVGEFNKSAAQEELAHLHAAERSLLPPAPKKRNTVKGASKSGVGPKVHDDDRSIPSTYHFPGHGQHNEGSRVNSRRFSACELIVYQVFTQNHW